MIKIIEQSNEAKCSTCGAKYSYEKSDIDFVLLNRDGSSDGMFYPYTECPHCGSFNIISGERG